MFAKQSVNSAMLALALCGAAGSVSIAYDAVAQDTAILSDASGALPSPDKWDCRRIAPEYDAWLEGGNSPASWRYAGSTYRNVADGKTYNWDDWLAWSKANCAVAQGQNAGNTGNFGLIGGVVGALGLTAVAAGGGGGGNDSPG